MIIQIIGIPGSGKTYIGNTLANQPNIVVIDTDEIMIDAFNMLIKKSSFRKDILDDNWEQLDSLVAKIRDKIIDKNKQERKNPIFVYAGITVFPHSHPDYIFLIKSLDLKMQFRRYLTRELSKLNNNRKLIEDIIDHEDAYLIYEVITNKLQLVEKFPPSYDEYKQLYESYMDDYSEFAHKKADANKIINMVRDIALTECGLR